MIIQNIGSRALSIYIDQTELSRMDFDRPQDIGENEAETILKTALKEVAIEEWETAEMEVYPGRGSLLIFARRKSVKPRHFQFGDFEHLASVCEYCPNLPSTLTATDDGYILTVYPFEGDSPPAILCEFGDEKDLGPYDTLHLKEQKDEIISAGAIGIIKKYFA